MTIRSMQRRLAAATLVIVCMASADTVLAADEARTTSPAAAWDQQAATRYLDGRQVWWQSWEHAKRDHGTICVSCHTQIPYALARPFLRGEMGEQGPSATEQTMLANTERRVRNWNQVEPFYNDATSGAGKSVESRNAESVLNAIILASYDASAGKQSEIARMAFENAWALQSKTGPDAGAWVWQNFNYSPWEGPTSQYYFAAQMAVAMGMEPGRDRHEKLTLLVAGKESAAYIDDPNLAPSLQLLLGYLRSHYEAQPLLNKVAALWAEQYFPGVLTLSQQNKLIEDLNGLQHADGGWSLTDLGMWERRDKTPLETQSDGFATGLIVLVREKRVVHAGNIPQVARGITWLVANQDKKSGAWPAWSLNKNRDPASDAGPFMSDAATGYAVMALEAHR